MSLVVIASVTVKTGMFGPWNVFTDKVVMSKVRTVRNKFIQLVLSSTTTAGEFTPAEIPMAFNRDLVGITFELGP